MPHELDASGNPILRHTRPSPRTLGKTVDPVTKKEVFFTKFGTQQLKFIDPAKPALGVKQLNVGQTFKGFTTTPVQTFKETFGFSPFGAPTVRDTAYPDLTITKGVGTTTPPPFPPDDNGEECDLGCLMTFRGCDCGCKDVKPCTTCDSTVCAECNAWDLQCEDCRTKAGTCTPPETPPPCDLGCLLTARGCDCGCKDVKPCTTCDSTVCAECNAWDLQCEDCRKKDGTCTPPVSPCGCLPFDIGCELGCWWEKNKNYVYIIGGIIGLGILLWLLRPLFGVAKNISAPIGTYFHETHGMK